MSGPTLTSPLRLILRDACEHDRGAIGKFGRVPPEHRLARHLVHVLLARIRTPRELKVYFPQRDFEPLVHDEHGICRPPGGWGSELYQRQQELPKSIAVPTMVYYNEKDVEVC